MPPPEPAAKHTTPESLLKECEAIEAELAALKVAYEQYFLGAERHPPLREHEALKKRVTRVQTGFVRNTALKFRVQSLQSKVLTYERLWQRTLQEIESGTYRRDLAKARRRSAAKSQPDGQRAAAASTAPRGTVELDDDPDFDLDRALAGLEAVDAPLPQPVIKVQVAAPTAAPPRAASPAPSVAVPAAPPIPSTTRPATAAAPPGLRAPGSAAAAPPPALRPAAPPLPPGATPPPSRAVALGPALSGTAPRPAAAPAPAPSAARAPAAPPRPPVASGPGVSDDKLRAVYDAYVTAKRRCQEDTSKLSFESVAGNLRKQVPELMRQHNAKAVEFKVVIKDGKAVLKAVPK